MICRDGNDVRFGRGWAGPLGCAAALVLAATAGAARAADAEGADRPPDRQHVQAAIAGALEWLAARQVRSGEEGYWDSPRYPVAATSFAGLAFLANGHRPGRGPYGEVLDRAMRHVQASMDAQGYVGSKENSMYVHAAGMLFALSYFGCCDEPDRERDLAEWCRKGLALIVESQRVAKRPGEQGGWRYTPDSRESDLSVTSWQLLVLHAARQCGYRIDDAVFGAALRYVNSGFVENEGEAPDKAGGFVYRPGVSRQAEPAVTGVAVFLKGLLEDRPDEKVARSLAYLRTFTPAWGGEQYKGYFFFGTFYMVQGMFQVGGEEWARFAPRIQRVLLDHQAGDGHWDLPEDNVPQSRLAGQAYATALGALILSVDNQYLPMYQRQRRAADGR